MSGYGLSKEKLEFIVNDIGNRLLPLFPKDELFKHLTVEDWLENLPKEELLKHLTVEDRLADLTAEERRKLKQLLEEDER